MKKNVLIRIVSGAILAACLLSCAVCMTVTASAKAEFSMVIPYGKPTVDGVIEEGEYAVSYVMNQVTATAWVGEVGESSVTWYVAWDEGGLYYAGTINDKTPAWRDEHSHWVGIDCLELAVNPGMLLSGDRAEGIFFSCGSAKDGSVVVYRHNFADGLVSEEVQGANKGHTPRSASYTMEVYLPWSLMQLDESCTISGKEDIRLRAGGWEPTGGAKLGLLPCAIDSLDAEGKNIIAYKFNGTDFVVSDFIEAVLMAPDTGVTGDTDSETSAETARETVSETDRAAADGTASEPSSEPSAIPPSSTDTPSETISDRPSSETEDGGRKGCGAALQTGLTAVLISAWGFILRKRKA